MPTFTKILVPVDFSSHSQNAVRVAADLAKRCDASLTLVHVYQTVSFALPDAIAFYTPTQLAEILSELDALLRAAKRDAELTGVSRVETALLQGAVATEIVEYAQKEGCDLIVMGTHGRTGVSHAIMGSVAERVVRVAPCPVLTLRAQET